MFKTLLVADKASWGEGQITLKVKTTKNKFLQ